jgi:RNA polymerase sigma factor (sigma-70 family)
LKASNDAEYAAFYRAVIEKAVHRGCLFYGDWHQAEDAAQEALIAAYQQWETKVGNLSQDERWRFIVRIMANKRISSLRRMKVHHRAMELLHRRHADSISIVHVDTDVEVREAIRLMQALPRQQRVVAVLHWVEDLPLTDISSMLDISPSAAREHLARARRALRKHLEEPALSICVVREPL